MTEASQKTILREGSISGVGLHSGKPSEVFFRPAAIDSGVHILKNGVSLGVLGRDHSLFLMDDVARCSAIGKGDSRILTVEHLLAAIYGLGISNLVVDVHGTEIPGMDGSAADFTHFLKNLGIAVQNKSKYFYRVTEPLFCHEPAKAIAIYPCDRFEVSYCLDYDYPGLRNQKAEFVFSADVFDSQIAPSRTFCTLEESAQLKTLGLGLGGTPENNIVVMPDGSHRDKLRFPDECARHKILDVIGDLSLLGFPVLGRVIGIRSGHSLNRKLVQAIRNQRGDGK